MVDLRSGARGPRGAKVRQAHASQPDRRVNSQQRMTRHGYEEEEEEEEGCQEEIGELQPGASRSRPTQMTFARCLRGVPPKRPDESPAALFCCGTLFCGIHRCALLVAHNDAVPKHIDDALSDLADRRDRPVGPMPEMRHQRAAHAAMRGNHGVALNAFVPGAHPHRRAARNFPRQAARIPTCRARAPPAQRLRVACNSAKVKPSQRPNDISISRAIGAVARRVRDQVPRASVPWSRGRARAGSTRSRRRRAAGRRG